MTLMLIADNNGALAVGGGGDVGGGGLQQDSELCGHQDSRINRQVTIRITTIAKS